jgi:hypothetical protein
MTITGQRGQASFGALLCPRQKREAAFQLSAFLLSTARSVVRGRVVPLAHRRTAAFQYDAPAFSLSATPPGSLLESVNNHRPSSGGL